MAVLLIPCSGTAHTAGDEHGLTNLGGPHKLSMQWFSTSCRSIQRLLAENGQRFDRVQRVVGHKDPRSTQLYADMAEYQVRQALEAGQ